MKKAIIVSGLLIVLCLSVASAAMPNWDITGKWVITFSCKAGCVGDYTHSMDVSFENLVTGVITGSGGYPAGGPFVYAWSINPGGQVSGDNIDFYATYTAAPDAIGTYMHVTGAIAGDGMSMGGVWSDNYPAQPGVTRNGTWTAVGLAQSIGGAYVNAGRLPDGSRLVVNVNYKVTNDEDSGNVGYWALDNYNRHLQVWQDPNDSRYFYSIARYDGKWNTFAGALSPGAGKTESKDAAGTMHGGYIGQFHGDINPEPAYKVSGNLGAFDFNGTKSDILLGTYGAGQTGAIPTFDWLGTYFENVTGFDQPFWGWTYQYKNQRWKNFDLLHGGTTGDIIV
jgi:hypothetical protein